MRLFLWAELKMRFVQGLRLTPVIEAKFNASKLVAMTRICLCGGWLLDDND
jgi:hypothetical protein